MLFDVSIRMDQLASWDGARPTDTSSNLKKRRRAYLSYS